MGLLEARGEMPCLPKMMPAARRGAANPYNWGAKGGRCVSTIGLLATTVSQLSRDIVGDLTFEQHEAAVGVAALANQIALLADLGQFDVGNHGHKPDAATRLLPPAYAGDAH